MKINTLTVLDLSTAHISPQTADHLDKTPLEKWPVAGGKTVYGYFVYAHEDNDGEIPEDLWTCINFARAQGCDYLYFDRDADRYDELPAYDW